MKSSCSKKATVAACQASPAVERNRYWTRLRSPRSKRSCCPAFTAGNFVANVAFLLNVLPSSSRYTWRAHTKAFAMQTKRADKQKNCTKTDGRRGSGAEIALSGRANACERVQFLIRSTAHFSDGFASVVCFCWNSFACALFVLLANGL